MFENVESPNAIREILNEMKHIIKESICIPSVLKIALSAADNIIRWRQNQMSWILLMWNILKQKIRRKK